MKHQRSLLLIVFIFQSLPLLARESMSLKEIQKYALDQSAELKAKFYQVQSDLSQKGLWPNPLLWMQGGFAHTDPAGGLIWEWTLSQSIPLPGKIEIQNRLNAAQVQGSQLQEQEARLMLQHAVTLSVAKFCRWNELFHYEKQRQKRFIVLKSFLKNQPHISPSQQLQVLAIQNQFLILKKHLLETEREKKMAELELRWYLKTNELPDVSFPWVRKPQTLDFDQIKVQVFKNNGYLKKSQLDQQIAQYRLDQVKQARYPDLSLGLNYREENVAPKNTYYAIILGWTLPLWDRGQVTFAVQEALLEKQRWLHQASHQQLNYQWELVQAQFETNVQLLKLYSEPALDQLKFKLNVLEKEFTKKRIHLVDFLQLDEQWHAMLEGYYLAQWQYLESLSQIQRLAGEMLWMDEASSDS